MNPETIIIAVETVLRIWQAYKAGETLTPEQMDLIHRLAEQAEDDALGTD